MKDLTLTITTTLVTLAGIFVLWQLHSIVLLFLFSLIIAAALRGPIEHLVTHRWPRWLAITFVYTNVCLVLVGLTLIVALSIGAELEQLAEELVVRYERGYGLLQTEIVATPAWLSRLPTTELVGAWLLGSAQSPRLLDRLLGFTQDFAYVAGQAVLAIVISVYWIADEWHFERLLLSLLAPIQRKRTRIIWRTLERNVGAYIRSEVSQSGLASALLTLGFVLMGFPYPYVMATIGALTWFIPLIGAPVGLVLIGLLAVLHSSTAWLLAVGYSALIFLILEFLVEPRLYQRNRYGTILVIAVMMIMVDAFGLFGLLLAPPLALIVQVALEELLSLPLAPSTVTTISLEELEEQVHQVQATITIANAESPQIANMLVRLEQLLQKAKEASQST